MFLYAAVDCPFERFYIHHIYCIPGFELVEALDEHVFGDDQGLSVGRSRLVFRIYRNLDAGFWRVAYDIRSIRRLYTIIVNLLE